MIDNPYPSDQSPADGRLAVFVPGMGGVATTFIAGLLARRGLAMPVGSFTRMGSIRGWETAWKESVRSCH
jgi:myo-inositol-1-phosphate synthase